MASVNAPCLFVMDTFAQLEGAQMSEAEEDPDEKTIERSRSKRGVRAMFVTINYKTKTDGSTYADAEIEEAMEADMEALKTLPFKYLVIGEHKGEKSKIRHLHALIEFENQRAFSTVKKAVPRADIQPRRGTATQARNYIDKEKKIRFEQGEPSSQGTKYKAVFGMIKAGKTLVEIAEEYPEEVLKHYTGVRGMVEMINEGKKAPLEDHPLLRWQQSVVEEISHPPTRRIHWFYDPVGGAGKTWFGLWLVKHKGAQMVTNAATKDVAEVWNPDHPGAEYGVMLFNLTKDIDEHVNYAVMEQVNDGFCFASKYHSRMKVAGKFHVIVFSNFRPRLTAFVDDRWHVTELTGVHVGQLAGGAIFDKMDAGPAPEAPGAGAPAPGAAAAAALPFIQVLERPESPLMGSQPRSDGLGGMYTDVTLPP